MPIYNPAPSSSGGSNTPTTTQGDLSVPSNTQLLFRRKIVMQAGQKIVLGTNAVLVGV